MKQQILKLAKRLNRFTLQDIQTMVELDEVKTIEILNALIDNGCLKQNKEEYFFIASVKTNLNEPKNQKRKIPDTLPNIEDLITSEEDLKLYHQLSNNEKETVYKYLVLIKTAGDLGGVALESFLLKFGKKYPKLQMAYTTFYKKRSLYSQGGFKAIIPKRGFNSGKTVVTAEQYNTFKTLYLSPDALTADECVRKMEKAGLFQNDIIPASITFERKLKKEFTKTQIFYFRKRPTFGSQILNQIAELNNQKYKSFIDGANAFLNSEYIKTLNQQKAICSGIKNHLIPYFKQYKFSDINEDTLRQFKKDMLSSGLSPASLSRLVIYLKYIVEGYSTETIEIQTYKKANATTLGLKNKYELITTVNKVKYSDLYLPVLLVVSLGLKLPEVEALNWDDIDLMNKEIKIDKIMLNGKLIKYRKNHQKRICKIPSTLCNVLKAEKAKAMKMFGNITNEELKTITNESNLSFDTLRDSYIKDLIDNKIPLNLIAKRLGFCHTNEFLEHYENLIDKTLLDNYDPLKI